MAGNRREHGDYLEDPMEKMSKWDFVFGGLPMAVVAGLFLGGIVLGQTQDRGLAFFFGFVLTSGLVLACGEIVYPALKNH